MSSGIFILGLGLGLILGSFTKALADRSINKVSFLGRSYCPKCQKTLKWYDLFPILSFFSTQGKCRYCYKKIGIEYPLTEIIFGILTAIIFITSIPTNFLSLTFIPQSLIAIDLVFKLFAICVLGALFLTDLKTGYLYDRLTIPAIVIAVIFLFLSTIYQSVLIYLSIKHSTLGQYLLPPYSDYLWRHLLINATPLFSSLLSGAILAAFFGALIALTKGRGMGGGDLKLAAFIGLVLGFPASILAILLAFILGSIFGVALILFGKKKLQQTIPFGPFLSVGAIIALIWGKEIIDFYLKLSI